MAGQDLGGVLAWGSLIHTPPDLLDDQLAAVGRQLGAGGVLVLGLFDGPDLQPFDHKVTTAWFWSEAGTRARLQRAGYTVSAVEHRPARQDARALLLAAAYMSA